MTEVLRPRDEADLRAAIGDALAGGTPVEVAGAGSRRALGGSVQAARRVSVAALAGITLYEPPELVLQARAGTPLAEIEAALGAEHQMLAFEPADFGLLLGHATDAATLGGTVAVDLAGPRRIKAGAARDHVLGARAVSGRAEVFKTGGRVVKNVTGYDLCKLLAGSWGTLAVMSEITVKVLPAPEMVRTVLAYGLADKAACALLRAALASPHEPSAAAHLPDAIAAASAVARVSGAGRSVTAVRIEGFAASVAARTTTLRDLFAAHAAIEELHGHNSAAFWREVRDAAYFAAATARGGRAVWRLSVPPAAGPDLVAAIAAETSAEAYYDWGGGLIWLAVDTAADARAATIRPAVRAAGGHAMLVRAPAPLRAAIEVFEPEVPELAALSMRIKDAFDPMRILNPGRQRRER
ncbi:MAG: glycolate oxidase subunit GlcE [Alphaproteobacteria bacterium]|nr:glycolate oxidase subunit GlcE [Alphaproteobacteria bacterium]